MKSLSAMAFLVLTTAAAPLPVAAAGAYDTAQCGWLLQAGSPPVYSCVRAFAPASSWTPPGPILARNSEDGHLSFTVYDTPHGPGPALPPAHAPKNYYGVYSTGAAGH